MKVFNANKVYQANYYTDLRKEINTEKVQKGQQEVNIIKE